MRFIALYIGTVVLVNVLFSLIPPVPLANGEVWPPASLLVGCIFVIRDYVQREVGHWVIPAMVIGAAMSGIMVEKEIALASICAFFFGEMIEWAIYTITKRPFSERMFWSCAVSTPIDSLIFLTMLGFLSWEGTAIMTASKMIGVIAVFFLAKRREKQQAFGATAQSLLFIPAGVVLGTIFYRAFQKKLCRLFIWSVLLTIMLFLWIVFL